MSVMFTSKAFATQHGQPDKHDQLHCLVRYLMDKKLLASKQTWKINITQCTHSLFPAHTTLTSKSFKIFKCSVTVHGQSSQKQPRCVGGSTCFLAFSSASHAWALARWRAFSISGVTCTIHQHHITVCHPYTPFIQAKINKTAGLFHGQTQSITPWPKFPLWLITRSEICRSFTILLGNILYG